MIDRLDEIMSDLSGLIDCIEILKLHDLQVHGGRYWVNDALGVLGRIDGIREDINGIKEQL